MLDVFDRLEFKALSRKSMPDCPPENKERVKALREQVKECLKELKGDYFFQCYEEMEGDWRHSAIPARVLIRLTLAFRARLAEKKSEKHLLDFSLGLGHAEPVYALLDIPHHKNIRSSLLGAGNAAQDRFLNLVAVLVFVDEKHLLDFSDVEHFALDILAERVPQEERKFR